MRRAPAPRPPAAPHLPISYTTSRDRWSGREAPDEVFQLTLFLSPREENRQNPFPLPFFRGAGETPRPPPTPPPNLARALRAPRRFIYPPPSPQEKARRRSSSLPSIRRLQRAVALERFSLPDRPPVASANNSQRIMATKNASCSARPSIVSHTPAVPAR